MHVSVRVCVCDDCDHTSKPSMHVSVYGPLWCVCVCMMCVHMHVCVYVCVCVHI